MALYNTWDECYFINKIDIDLCSSSFVMNVISSNMLLCDRNNRNDSSQIILLAQMHAQLFLF